MILDAETGQPYKDLFEILKDKNYYILTTNQDTQFTRVFPEEKISAIQGDWRYFQCSRRCHDELYDSVETLHKLNDSIDADLRVPSELIPRCPECGWKMVPWVQDNTFLQGEAWQTAYQRYEDFVRKYQGKKLLLLELGVGEMTPSIIKLPFWELTAKNENVFYACLNREVSHSPEHLRGRSLYLQGDLAETLAALRQARSIAATIK